MTAWPQVPLRDVFEIGRGGSPRPIDAFITDDADVHLTDGVAQSVFDTMFGARRNWETLLLGTLADIVSGVTKGRSLAGKATREVAYLAVSNVKDRRLDLSTVKRIPATDQEIERYRPRKFDLFLTEGGDPDELGRGTLWNNELDECIRQNHIFRVRVTTPRLKPLFLDWLTASAYGREYFVEPAKQTTGIASINMTQLRNFPVILPDPKLQNDFVRRIAAIDRVRKHQSSSGVAWTPSSPPSSTARSTASSDRHSGSLPMTSWANLPYTKRCLSYGRRVRPELMRGARGGSSSRASSAGRRIGSALGDPPSPTRPSYLPHRTWCPTR